MKVIHYFFCSMLLVAINFVHADELPASENNEVITPANETQITDKTQTVESPLTKIAQKGYELHERHCKFCHSGITNEKPAQLYTRPNHKVQNYSSLKNKVFNCVNSLGIPWFEDEMAEVTTYLNEMYYQFNTETTQ